MQVNITLYATFRKFAPPDTPLGESFKLELDIGTINELIERLGLPENQVQIILVNGNRIMDKQQKLKPDDLVVIFPPIGGG